MMKCWHWTPPLVPDGYKAKNGDGRHGEKRGKLLQREDEEYNDNMTLHPDLHSLPSPPWPPTDPQPAQLRRSASIVSSPTHSHCQIRARTPYSVVVLISTFCRTESFEQMCNTSLRVMFGKVHG
jgi:hypothetical protein